MASYNKEIDYRKLIDEAVARGDYNSAGIYEATRNRKIADLGLTEAPTYDYGKYVNVYSNGNLLGQGAGLLNNTVALGYGNQADNVSSSKEPGLKITRPIANNSGIDIAQQTAMDAIAKLMSQSQNQNSYASPYSGQIDSLLAEVMGSKFNYDPTSDPMYMQTAQLYRDEGKRAMTSTLAEIAARTGGIASSYAGTAAAQAGQAYSKKEAELIPALTQLAMQRYQNDLNQKMNVLGALQGLDQSAYAKHRDMQGDQFNLAQLLLQQGNRNQEWQYQQNRDAISDVRYQDEATYQRKQAADELRRLMNNDEFNQNMAIKELERMLGNDKFNQEMSTKELQRLLDNDEFNQNMSIQELQRLLDNDATSKEQWQKEYDQKNVSYSDNQPDNVDSNAGKVISLNQAIADLDARVLDKSPSEINQIVHDYLMEHYDELSEEDFEAIEQMYGKQ